jgi:hypothetical protein
MKPTLVKLITFISICTVLFNYSCRKINDKEPSQIIISDKLEQEFFKVPENISPQLQEVINDIKKQNDQYHFLPEFLRKNGMPVWNKVVANVEGLYPVNNKSITNRFSGRLSSQDSAEVYFIPLIMPDNKIITFLTCVKINNRYSLKVYRRNYLTNLNITTDSLIHYRNAALGIFRYFEKAINNKDTIQVGGVVQQIFSDANIIFNERNSENKTVELIGSRQLSSITVSYCFGGVQMRLSRNAKVLNTGGGCWSESILVYGSDLGISIISGGYSGDGLGGGGSGGSGTGVVFDCPAGLWWCESGEYRFVDGVLYTSLEYPGKNKGFPWAWWETGSYQTANLPMVFLNLEMLDLILEQAQYLINEPTLNQKLNYYLITDNGQTPEEKKQAAFDHINGLLTNSAYATFVQNYEATDNTGKMWWENDAWININYPNQKIKFDLETGDKDNNTDGGFDNTTYQEFNPINQSWPTINNVIPNSDFVGWGTNGITRNCMSYAKAQIAKKGYQISNYNATGQTFQIYTSINGPNKSVASSGVSYLISALQRGIPIIVGVDDQPGSANPATDNTTDHFIVIVGMGTDANGNYLLFLTIHQV